MRSDVKDKSQQNESSSAKRPKLAVCLAQSSSTKQPLSSEDLARHIKEIQLEYKKSSPDKVHIKQLMRETFHHRLELGTKEPIHEVFSKYTCLADAEFVSVKYTFFILTQCE
jgi:septum formation topological specificity factor MinE